MAPVSLTNFPAELILQILELANTSKDLSALIQTHPIFYDSWRSSPRLVCQAVLVNEGCLHPAQLLLRVQTGGKPLHQLKFYHALFADQSYAQNQKAANLPTFRSSFAMRDVCVLLSILRNGQSGPRVPK
jgi:hypothetical protein